MIMGCLNAILGRHMFHTWKNHTSSLRTCTVCGLHEEWDPGEGGLAWGGIWFQISCARLEKQIPDNPNFTKNMTSNLDIIYGIGLKVEDCKSKDCKFFNH